MRINNISSGPIVTLCTEVHRRRGVIGTLLLRACFANLKVKLLVYALEHENDLRYRSLEQ